MEMSPLMVSCCRDNGTSLLTDMGLTGVALIIPTILTKHMYMYRDHLIHVYSGTLYSSHPWDRNYWPDN